MSILPVDFGYLHKLTAAEVERGYARAIVHTSVRGGNVHDLVLVTPTLRRGIPDLFWLTAFGPSYRERFSDERLLSSPCHSTRRVGESIVLQLSAHLDDLEHAPEEIDRVRRAVMRHLGPEVFLQGEGYEEQRESLLFRIHD
jgi:hypothetical protein